MLEVLLDGERVLFQDNTIAYIDALNNKEFIDIATGITYTVVMHEVEKPCHVCKGYGECCSSYASFASVNGKLVELGEYKSNPAHNGYHDTHGAQCIRCHGFGVDLAMEAELIEIDVWDDID